MRDAMTRLKQRWKYCSYRDLRLLAFEERQGNTITMFRSSAVVLISILVAVSYGFSGVGMSRRFGTRRVTMRAEKPSIGRKMGACITIFSVLSSTPALGDDMLADFSSEPAAPQTRAIGVSTVTTRDTKSTSKVGESIMDDSYKNSLERERAKQAVSKKKSKAEKARDLCESLGRGC
jgi:hypothetical protein